MEQIDWKRYGVQEVIRLRERKERDRTGLFYVDGLRFVAEAVKTGAKIEALFYAPAALANDFGLRLTERLKERRVPCLPVSADTFDRFSQTAEKQGIGAVVRQNRSSLAPHVTGGCWMAVEAVQSPGNLGTVVRTCDAAGASGIIMMGPAVDPYDPGCVRATMGSLFAVPLIRVSHRELARWAARNRVQMVGTDADGDRDFRSICYRRPTVFVMGSERKGLSDAQRRLCIVTARIPMVGRCDSLNLGVAASILIYEAFRHKAPSSRPTKPAKRVPMPFSGGRSLQ